MEKKSTANIGGFYPMNQYRFVPFKQAPIPKEEPTIPMKECSGIPIAALDEPLPPVVNATFVPNVPLTKDEIDLRRFQVEEEMRAQEKQREQQFIYELQGRVNTDERQKQDFQNLIERKITELAGSNMPINMKVLQIQELMTSADSMGLNPQVASPMLLEALQRYGMSAGFAGIIQQLQQNQQIAQQAPQQPILHQGSGFGGGGNDIGLGTTDVASNPYFGEGLMAIMGGKDLPDLSSQYHGSTSILDPEEYYASIQRQAVAKPQAFAGAGVGYGDTSYLPPPLEVDGGGFSSEGRGQEQFQNIMREERGILPGQPAFVTDSSATSRNPADILQHGDQDDGGDFMTLLRRIKEKARGRVDESTVSTSNPSGFTGIGDLF